MAIIKSGQEFNKEKHRKEMRNRMENMDVTKCTFRIPTHIYTKFKIKVASDRRNMKQIILSMILKYIGND